MRAFGCVCVHAILVIYKGSKGNGQQITQCLGNVNPATQLT